MDNYLIRRVCLQTASQTVKAKDNTQVNTTALLLVDAVLTSPRLDWL